MVIAEQFDRRGLMLLMEQALTRQYNPADAAEQQAFAAFGLAQYALASSVGREGDWLRREAALHAEQIMADVPAEEPSLLWQSITAYVLFAAAAWADSYDHAAAGHYFDEAGRLAQAVLAEPRR